jgi:hypothetical protein
MMTWKLRKGIAHQAKLSKNGLKRMTEAYLSVCGRPGPFVEKRVLILLWSIRGLNAEPSAESGVGSAPDTDAGLSGVGLLRVSTVVLSVSCPCGRDIRAVWRGKPAPGVYLPKAGKERR